MTIQRFETEYAGKQVIIETGRYALQSSAHVTVQIGDTVVLASAAIAPPTRDIDYFPLMIDYEERYFAVGKIKGPRFSKREGRPSNEAILIGRMIDRGLRPLFPQNIKNEVQIICLPLSLDGENRPDIVAMLAACAAIHISEIPFDGPIVGARIGMINGYYEVNPTVDEMEYSDLNLVVMGDGERISMVDCDAQDLKDDRVEQAFEEAMKAMGPMAKFLDEIREKIGKPKLERDGLVLRGELPDDDKALIEEMKKASIPHLETYLFNKPKGSKRERKEALNGLKEMLVEQFKAKAVTPERDEEKAEAHIKKLLGGFFYDFIEEQVSLAILDKDQRVDGRALDQIRPLSGDVGFIPRTHGSGLFTRGETQILSIVTLAGPSDDLLMETMESDGNKSYFHHYNFLPYSVGDIKPLRGAGRREIGHGALAEKALVPVIPDNEDFPYTIRVVSEVMGSNGSSSMASTCGSTLALMDAGVPIKKPVGGMAMGMASDGTRWKILTDLQDLEDGNGGMDFKFTGTRDGLTAIQMDTKTRGLTADMIKATFPQMRKALNEAIDTIEAIIPAPREELSQFAPRIIQFGIDPEKIGEVIGPGGKVIKNMTEKFDVKIDIEDDGTVSILSNDPAKGKAAEEYIREIVRVIQVGDVFEDAEVVKIMSFGAFVNLTPGKDGMLHVSELEWGRVENVTDKVKQGDKVTVKVIKIDKGKIDVSMRVLQPKPDGYVERERPPRRDSRDRRDSRGSRDRRDNRGSRDRRDSGDRRDSRGPPKHSREFQERQKDKEEKHEEE